MRTARPPATRSALARRRCGQLLGEEMRNAVTSRSIRSEVSRGFEAVADAIMYRWTVERDTWVSPTEVEHARVYLEKAGITTRPLPDGRFEIDGVKAGICEAAPLVMMGLRHLHAARRTSHRRDI